MANKPGKVCEVIQGDCLVILSKLKAASVDSVVTDPPGGISFQGKAWDDDKGGRQAWVAWLTSVMRECHRVLKPGGHALVWAMPRTSHWTTWAIEDAGFEVRDVIAHVHMQGFPKSLDVSKAIDKAAGASRKVIGTKAVTRVLSPADIKQHTYAVGLQGKAGTIDVTAPSTDAAKEWQGWGTATKPAYEPWIVARKPLDGTVVNNLLKHGRVR